MSPDTSPAEVQLIPAHPGTLPSSLEEPRRPYARPVDVLDDVSLDTDEKREVLSFWASDACAVESAPALRQLPGAPSPVSIDEIMSALVRLDGAQLDPAPGRRADAPVLKAKSHPRRFAW